jgi:hypothetical protein
MLKIIQKAHMKELVNELVAQIDELGFYSEKFEDNRPLDATHYLEYTANWAWDMTMHLTFLKQSCMTGDS